MSKRPARRRRPVWLWLAACLACMSAWAAPIDPSQRDAFRQAYATAQQGGDSWRGLSAQLQSYPLYPYLEAAALSHDLRQLSLTQVQSYLDRYPDWIPAADLRRDFLYELARRQDWTAFRTLYRPGQGEALSCYALQAQLAAAQPLDFNRDLAALWDKPSLPDSCNPVLDAAHSQGLLSTERLWARIDRAASAGQPGTIATLAAWLPAEQMPGAQHLAQALRDPQGATSAALTWPDTERERQAAALALQRLARRQSSSADQAWQQLQARFAFSGTQRNAIVYALALYHATDFDDNALARLIDLPPAAQTDASREWRVRVALAQQDWLAVERALDALSPDQQQQDEWRYFRARALDKLGRADQAKSLYAALAQQPTYFGFLAADWLQQPYSICPLQLATDPVRENALLQQPGLTRAFELYALGMQRYARREWSQALAGADPATLRLAADLAYRNGWYDRAVFTFNGGDALRLYEQRFPLAGQDGLVPQASAAGIDPAWAYGILRAESAWMSDARSGADARGLMQLLPSTAELVAKRNNLPWAGGQSLYDPAVNVVLGTRYLAQMAARYNGAPWLASAAYNAGPNKVDQWLSARGTLEPDLFVATIPFKETREYVARVMAFAVIYDWRLNDRTIALRQRMTPIGKTYSLPDSQTPRKQVQCIAAIDKPEAPPTAPTGSTPAPAASSGP
jgi:soluble lytic murein transglycosylase